MTTSASSLHRRSAPKSNTRRRKTPRPEKPSCLLINPSILEAHEVEGQTTVSVLYDVMMRENGTEMAKQVRELWHFSRETRKPMGFWVLEGIQQMER